jgi:hypothetical protein
MDPRDPRRPVHRGAHPLAQGREERQAQAEHIERTMAAQRQRDENIAHAAGAFAGLCMALIEVVDKHLLGREVDEPDPLSG